MSMITSTPPVVLDAPPGQPDITYTPDRDKYILRGKKRALELTEQDKRLPAGFPNQLGSPLVWDGQNLAQRFNWTYKLTELDVKEIDAALNHFKSLNKPKGYINQDTFPLPSLHQTLRSISDEIHNGHGFKVISGIPVTEYSRDENIIIYAGVSSHVASVRGRQDHQYEGKPADLAVAHIIDLSHEIDRQKIGSPAFTTEKQVFHTDSGDIVSLFALGVAAEGGTSYLSSSWAVYNELAKTRPDIIKTLSEPWNFDNYGKDHHKGYTSRPLLYYQPTSKLHDGTVAPERTIINYARRYFTGYWGLPRTSTIPPITEAQAEALDALHFTAERLALALEFQQGDIQYVNNLSIFHARGGFKDSKTQRRHLLRLWLRDPENAWETPAPLKYRWGQLYDDLRPEREVFPLEPSIRSESKGQSK